MSRDYTTMTVSFSEANQDAYQIIKSQPRGQSSQFICDAVRFYEKHKGKTVNIEKELISEMIDDKLEKLIENKGIALIENRGTHKEKEITNIKDIGADNIAAIKNFDAK